MPPPPTAAIIAIGIIKANKTDPKISNSVSGKASFLSQILSPWSNSLHIKYPESPQSD